MFVELGRMYSCYCDAAYWPNNNKVHIIMLGVK